MLQKLFGYPALGAGRGEEKRMLLRKGLFSSTVFRE